MESVYRTLLVLLLPLTLGMSSVAQEPGDTPPVAEATTETVPNPSDATDPDAAALANDAIAADEAGEDASAEEATSGAASASDPEAEFLAGAMGSGLFEESVPQLRRVALVILGGLILLYFGLAFYRRLGSGKVFGATPKRRIRVADTVSLGGKRYLCAVEAMGQTLLVGVSGDRIQLLTELHGDPDGSSFDETFERTAEGMQTRRDPGADVTAAPTGDAP